VTAVGVAVLVTTWVAAVGLLVARTQTQRWACIVLAFTALTVRAWLHHDSRVWVATFALLAVASLATLLWSRRTTNGN
jgi:hypothetical protein